MPPRRPFRALLLVTLGAAILAACGDVSGLPRATFVNRVDTVALFALGGSPISTPSAYNIVSASPVRTDRESVAFDFAFNIDAAGRPVLLPTGALGLGQASGILVMTAPFDSIKTAASGGYELEQPVPVSTGTVAVMHSRLIPCAFGANVFLYAKLQVLAIDLSARSVAFQILVDMNCGYRGLETGLPSR